MLRRGPLRQDPLLEPVLLTRRYSRAYPRSMLRQGFFPALVLTLLVWTSETIAAPGTEFYSWIDPSGTMVMTDDPSQIPPSAARSPVSIHRYQERPITHDLARHPSRKPASSEQESLPRQDPLVEPTKQATQVVQKTEPAVPAETESAPVLLETPEETARNQYLWMPLLAPVYLGGNLVSGFWSHRSVSSPVEAFRRFLAKHDSPKQQILIAGGRLQLGNVFNAPSSSAPSPARVRSNAMTPVYDQVMRERQAMVDRTFTPAHPSRSAGSPSSRGGHGGRSR
jgi:hypothetical protein